MNVEKACQIARVNSEPETDSDILIFTKH